MAGHHLIDAYLTAIAQGLPRDAVDELADGLTETHQAHLTRGLDPDAAADAAIAEFGEPDVVLAAFVRQAPGRRAARALLASGPAVGLCWAVVLVGGHAWTWPPPVPLRLTFGVALLLIVGTLAIAATGHRSYRRTQASAVAGLGLVMLDTTTLVGVLLLAPPFTWPLGLAVLASATRIALTAHALPRLLPAR